MRPRLLLPLFLLAACRNAPAPSPQEGPPRDGPRPAATADAAPAPQPPPSETSSTLAVGDPAPAFSLLAEDGSTFESKTALAHGPVVAVFYRGDW